MDKKTIGDWIMYYEVQRLKREGLSSIAIGKALVIDRRTVKRYSGMSEAEYASFLESKEARDKLLTPYESFVHDKLAAHPAVSAAQMHDWLKEYHPDFVHTAPKTVYNFVMALRQKYNIPLEEASREYFVVEQLPYGQQAQADFGHYILRGTEDRRKRIHFFVMMLSRSRMKFVLFSDAPFTTSMTIDAHEEAFKFFSGMPREIVYDQDRLLLVEERMGELLLTREFKDYVFEQEFQLHFCKKADPQSKGKVENVVKYVKNNFLYGRLFYDLQTLQGQAMAWLQRTGNAMPHSTTRKIPLEEWQNEQPHLRKWVSVKILPSYILRTVRKDNTFAYLGNFYSVPQGTFRTKDTMVMIWLKEEELHVHDKEGVFLCKHAIAQSKGNTVINTDHKRDKSLKLKDLLTQTANGVGKSLLAAGFCHHALQSGYRAYFRTMDQIMTTLKTKDISRSAMADYKKLYKAHLIVIDDIMMIAIARQDANSFFHFINALHERTSFIITTNKSPKEWAETIGDEVITTALLDRILYRCEIIKLSGESYRMKHRKTIFEKTK
jgi:transposase